MDPSFIQQCLDALECPDVAALIQTNVPITHRHMITSCDPTAVLRLTSLFYEDGQPIFPQFQQDVLTLHHSYGAPLKLQLGSKRLKLFTHQLKALRFLRHCDAQFTKDLSYTRGLSGAVLVLKMGLGKTLVAMTYACMLPHPIHVPSSSRSSQSLQSTSSSSSSSSLSSTSASSSTSFSNYDDDEDENPEFPTLVVASKTVMTMWQLDGFEKFFLPNSVRILYLHKDWIKQDDIDALTREQIIQYDFVVTTYDVVLNLARQYPETLAGVLIYGRAGVWGENPNAVKDVFLRTRRNADHPEWTGIKILYGTPWKMDIADESQRYANPKTKTFRAMMGLYGYRKLCLTGTPIRNYKTDLWAQLRWMGYRGIGKAQHWRPMYMDIHNLHTCILTIDYPDTDITMPPRHDVKHELTFSPIENQVYQFVLAKAEEALDQMLQHKLDFVCVLALFTRLRQICIAPYLITTMSKRNGKVRGASTYAEEVLAELEADGPLWSQIKMRTGIAGMGSTKIQTIVSTIRALPKNEKVLIFSMFTSALDLMAGALEGLTDLSGGGGGGGGQKEFDETDADKSTITENLFAEQDFQTFSTSVQTDSNSIGYEQLDGDTKDRAETMRRFKTDPNCQVLLITYKVGSEGLNLTEANHVFLLEPWWTYAVPDQAMARAWRPGQTKPVTMHNMVVQQTIEDHVITICEEKKAMAATFMNHTTTLGDTVTETNTRLNAQMLQRILRRPS